MKLVEIKPNEDRAAHCRRVVEDYLAAYGSTCEVVVILGIDKVQGEFMMANHSTQHEKTHLFAFFQAIVMSWFNIETR